MPNRSYNQYCPLARALDIVGDRWTLLILRNLLLGPQRWSELLMELPGIARNLLSSRLHGLIEHGLIEHVDERYQLTDRGAELEEPIFSIARWGAAHVMGPPSNDESIRLRYLMTSMRRKLAPTAQTGLLRLDVDGSSFRIVLGANPSVVQAPHSGETNEATDSQDPHDAALAGSFSALAQLLFDDVSVDALRASGAVDISGDPAVVDAWLDAWRGRRW